MRRHHQALMTVLAKNEASAVTPPAQPTSLSATPVSTSQIDLAWTDNADDETAYRVYRSTDNITYSQVVGDLAADIQAYSDATITSGQSYYYKVAAVNTAGETLSDAAHTNTLLLGLTAYWKLDEESDGSGAVTRNDSVGTSHLSDLSPYAASGAGKISNGVDLELSNIEGLRCLDNTALSMGDIDFSIACWVKPESSATMVIYTKGISGGAGGFEYILLITVPGAAGRFRFAVGNAVSAGVINADAIGAPIAGTWYFIACWHDASANKVYIQVNNGTINSVDWIGGSVDTAENFRLGQLGDGTLPFDGVIDEFAVAKRVWTADERASLYNGGDGVTYPF